MVSWLIDYGYGLLVDNLGNSLNITVDLSAKTVSSLPRVLIRWFLLKSFRLFAGG